MLIGVTGATGFLGRYIVRRLVADGHSCRCWYREQSDRSGFEGIDQHITWSVGRLGDPALCYQFAEGCDAIVHAALSRPGRGFRDQEGQLTNFVRENVLGSIELFEESRAAGVQRIIVISTCAVHEKILDDRPLDEAHPVWPLTHYGASKAALEAFVCSYGRGHGYNMCAVRPCGIYGLAHPAEDSKWYALIRDIVAGRPVDVRGGGKEVHAADVAQAVSRLLQASNVAGEVFNCCDGYVSQLQVAELARELSGSDSVIQGQAGQPKHQIETAKLRALGFQFGGTELLRQTVRQLIDQIRQEGTA
ncbi:MAG: NAD(P)-dependent oxidoreductase [Pirellulales bacterium]